MLRVYSLLLAVAEAVDWTPVVKGVVAVLGGLLTLLAWRLDRWLGQRADTDGKRAILDRARGFVRDKVKDLRESVVPDIVRAAADGKISREEAQGLRTRVLSFVRASLGAPGVEQLNRATGDLSVDEWILAAAHAELFDVKAAAPPRTVATATTKPDGTSEARVEEGAAAAGGGES